MSISDSTWLDIDKWQSHARSHARVHTTILKPCWILSGTTRVRWHHKGKTRNVNTEKRTNMEPRNRWQGNYRAIQGSKLKMQKRQATVDRWKVAEAKKAATRNDLDRTSASYNHILVLLLSLFFFQIFWNLPNTVFVFPALVIMSFLLTAMSVRTHPKYQKFSTSSILFPRAEMTLLAWHFPMVNWSYLFSVHWL